MTELDRLAAETLDALRARGLMCATAESCTGGGVAHALTAIPGSSAVFERGFLVYSNAAKTELLGVPPEVLKAHGAVSEPVAEAMAEGAVSRSAAQVAVGITGVAGPGAAGSKPEGRVCFALAAPDRATHVETVDFGPLGRAEVRAASVLHALRLLRDAAG